MENKKENGIKILDIIDNTIVINDTLNNYKQSIKPKYKKNEKWLLKNYGGKYRKHDIFREK